MKITKDMTIGEILTKHPKCLDVLVSFGMGCTG